MRLQSRDSTLYILLLITSQCAAASFVSGPSGGAQLHAPTAHRHEGNSPEDPTYSELAASLVPAQWRSALRHLTSLSASSQPDEVKTLRVNLLAARELLDIFSYTYPLTGNVSRSPHGQIQGTADVALDTASASHSPKHQSDPEKANRHSADSDLWEMIRNDLDEGYETLGAFQDLAHSLVEYNETDVQQLLSSCLQWQDAFLSHILLRPYTAYLASPGADHLYKRPLSKLSKLYWGFKGTRPSLQLSGHANLALLATSQMQEAGKQLPVVLAMKDIWNEPLHSRFHLYRKLVRSLLSVLEASPGLLDIEAPLSADRNTAMQQQQQQGQQGQQPLQQQQQQQQRQQVLLGRWAEVWEVVRGWHARVKETVGGWWQALGVNAGVGLRAVEEGCQRMGSTASRGLQGEPEVLRVHQNKQLSGLARSRGHHQHRRVADVPCPLFEDFVRTLDRLFHDLGQVNNWIVSYEFYIERGEAAQAEGSRQQVVSLWSAVSGWMRDQDLGAQLACVEHALAERWRLLK